MPGIDSYTKLLLHCNGSDGSTSFPDASADNVSLTANGNAQVDTAQSEFGGASGLFDSSSGDYLLASDSSSWDFGTDDWTIDFWIRRNGSQAEFAGVIGGDSGYGWAIHFGYSGEPGGSTLNKIRFVFNQTQATVVYSSSIIPDLTWTHVAFVRYGNYLKVYINGTESGSVDISAYTLNSSGTGLTIGRLRTNQDDYYFNGHLDEVRISKGIARWTTNFTPPTEEYLDNESLNISESLSLDDEFTTQINPDNQEISDSLSLDDSFLTQINPDSQVMNDSLSLDDGWIVNELVEYLNINDTINLSDDWVVNTLADSIDISDTIQVDDDWIINTFEIIKTSFDTKLYTVAGIINSYFTDLRTVFNTTTSFNTKLYTQALIPTSYNTDLRVRTTPIDELVLGSTSDFIVYLDAVELVDIDYKSLNIHLSLNTTPSNAQFTLARRHDDLDKTISGATSVITEENKIEIYDGTIKLFTGYISQIDADSTRDVVNITASDCRLKMSRNSMELRYGGAWQPDSNHNGIIDDDDTTGDISFNRPDYIKFEKNIETAFIEVMTAVGSLVSGYDSLPFSGSFVPEYIKTEKNYTELIDDLIRQTANCNWYIDENERLRFQKIASGSIKTLPLASLNAKRNPYDLIVNNVQLNRPSSGYAQSLIIKRGKDLKDTYRTRTFAGWTYDIFNSSVDVFTEFYKFLNSLKEKEYFVFQWKNTNVITGSGEYTGVNTNIILSYSIYALNQIWYWAYPKIIVQWVDRILNKNLPDITVGSGLPKKTIYLNSYGKKSSNRHYSEEIKTRYNPNIPIVLGNDTSDIAYYVAITDENYDQTDYCLDLANFELNQNNKMLSTAILSLILDTYEYYNLSFMDLINLSNTIKDGIYNNNNGFPLNIESVHINCGTRVVSLNLSNYGKTWYAKTAKYLLNYTPSKIEYLQEKVIFTYQTS